MGLSASVIRLMLSGFIGRRAFTGRCLRSAYKTCIASYEELHRRGAGQERGFARERAGPGATVYPPAAISRPPA